MATYYTGDNPCRGCERRKQGCHARCEDYNAWKATAVEDHSSGWQTPAHERFKKRCRSRYKKD